jgi:hypothetical protein
MTAPSPRPPHPRRRRKRPPTGPPGPASGKLKGAAAKDEPERDQEREDKQGMEVDVKLAKQAIFWRGLFINRYSGIEYAIAELVSRAFLHQAYTSLGHPPFGPAKKLKRLRSIMEIEGPIAEYRGDIQSFLDEFAEYEEHRHFMAHAMMVPRTSNDILFKCTIIGRASTA